LGLTVVPLVIKNLFEVHFARSFSKLGISKRLGARNPVSRTLFLAAGSNQLQSMQVLFVGARATLRYCCSFLMRDSGFAVFDGCKAREIAGAFKPADLSCYKQAPARRHARFLYAALQLDTYGVGEGETLRHAPPPSRMQAHEVRPARAAIPLRIVSPITF
jgi:hypothetical protein